MSLDLPLKADLNSNPTVSEYKDAIGSLYDFILSGFLDPVAGAGTANAQTATLGEIVGYKTNRLYSVRPTVNNTGACTYNFDSLGAKSVKLVDGSNPWSGAIQANVPVHFRYDGTNLVLLNPYPTAAARALLDDADAAAQLVTLGLTANAAELNTLDGVTASTAELNKLDGVTASTAELNILDGVTANASEINAVLGATTGTYTGTVTGLTTSPTVSVRYVRVGRIVVLDVTQSATGTSNTGTRTITGAPTSIRPAASSGFGRVAVNNSAGVVTAPVRMLTNGALEILPVGGENGGVTWGASTIWTQYQFSLTYYLN